MVKLSTKLTKRVTRAKIRAVRLGGALKLLQQGTADTLRKNTARSLCTELLLLQLTDDRCCHTQLRAHSQYCCCCCSANPDVSSSAHLLMMLLALTVLKPKILILLPHRTQFRYVHPYTLQTYGWPSCSCVAVLQPALYGRIERLRPGITW